MSPRQVLEAVLVGLIFSAPFLIEIGKVFFK